MVTQDIAYIYIHINIDMYIHIYIPSYIYNIHSYTYAYEERQKDLLDLRSWDSNIEFVKNSYHLCYSTSLGILKQVKVKFKKENKEVCNLWAALKSPFDHYLFKKFPKADYKSNVSAIISLAL